VRCVDARIRALGKELKALLVEIDKVKELANKGVVPLRKFEEIKTRLKATEHKKRSILAMIELHRCERETLIAKIKALDSLRKRIKALSEKDKLSEGEGKGS